MMKAQNRFYFAWPWHSKISPKIVDRDYFGPKIDHSSVCERIQDTSLIAGDFGFGARTQFLRNFKTSAKYLNNYQNREYSKRSSFNQVRTFSNRTPAEMSPKKVCIVGSGNWGSAIARLVGVNTARFPERFVKDVNMWVFEEMVDGRKLTEIINTEHENVKYLPGRKLPENIVAKPDISEAALEADLLIFVLPHQFVKRSCAPLVGKLKPGANGLSLIKGFSIVPGGGVELLSEVIRDTLSIPCGVLMGANLANEVADEKFCETTIGCLDPEVGQDFKLLFQTENFRVTVVKDTNIVEICGALKNIVACAAGFCDGLKMGDNTKAAIIRLGLKEMIKYGDTFYPGGDHATYFESCGVADLITTCYGGRNRKVSEAFVARKKSIVELETEMLNGQKLQGPETAAEVNYMLASKGLEADFPLFTAVHKVCIGQLEPEKLIEAIKNHPAHL